MTQEAEQLVPEINADSEVTPITDINEFAGLVSQWHQVTLAKLGHLVNVPDGITFEIDGKPLVLTGATLEGFKFGVEMATMEVSQFPFVVDLEETEEPPVTG
jgi:hypothetical protein